MSCVDHQRPPVPGEPPEVHKLNAQWLEQQTPWRSIYVTAALAYCTAVQFSLYFSSLWPYLQIVRDLHAFLHLPRRFS
jgi:hypothetical protein